MATRKEGKASWLFDPGEAADVDLNTLFDIGCNGLLELERVEPRFAGFKKTLFSDKFKAMDRDLETREANDDVDALVLQFCRLLGPYAQQKAALKVVEYLLAS